MAEAPRVLERDELELVLDGILAAAGPGRYVLAGPAEPVARALRERGLDAECLPSLPRDAAQVAECDVLVLWHALDALDAGAAQGVLEALRPRVRAALLARSDASGRGAGARGESWFEQAALEAGYRKHPLYLQLTPYEQREFDGAEEMLLLEPLPAAVLARRPLASLAAERDLHMDMLREAGRRSDAHVERYRLALQFVRPGDTVLDVACGLGYGSRTLFTGSMARRVIGVDESASAVDYARECYGIDGRIEFHRGDAQDLAFLPDASVDLVVSFETLEHLREPQRLLDEARRVLRPSGRLVACIPNRWVDESGEDPNPHHHHVYDWPRLRGEVGARFLVERGFRQVAGGGMTHTRSPRLMREFAIDAAAPEEAEWFLVVAMRDPAEGAQVPYVETSFPGYESVAGFHVARFDEDYANPWLVKGLVSIGFRFEERAGLERLATRVADESPAGSADQGAALCVLAYALLDRAEATPAQRAAMRSRLADYVQQAGGRPHELRWKISNLYVQALLHLRDRELPQARRGFERCAAMDPAGFSPLLATKTVGAAYNAGLLALMAGDAAAAREHWVGGIESARRAVGGDWANVVGRTDRPLYFGLPEAGIVLGKASKCAFALGALADAGLRPGRFWVEASRDFETQAARESRNARHAVRALQDVSARAAAAAPHDAGVQELHQAIARQARQLAEMQGGMARQAEHTARLSAAVIERDRALAEQARLIAENHKAFELQASSISHLQEELGRRDRALAEQGRELGRQAEAFAEQARNIAGLQARLNERDTALATQAETIAGMHAAFSQQAANIEELNQRLYAADRELRARDAALDESRAMVAGRDRELGGLRARVAAIEGSRLYRMLRRWIDGGGR